MKKKVLLALVVLTISILAFGVISASAAANGIYTYTISNDEATITDCDTSANGDIVIPDTLGGYPVTAIDYKAFSNCSSIINITIPKGVTSIGNYAFVNCGNLVSISIPDTVTSIGNYAFSSCDSLAGITIPHSVTSIGSWAFEYCNNLARVDITDLAAWCKISFRNSSSNPLCYAGNLYLNGVLVTKITIPNSVTSISSCSFYNCSSLAGITIPNSVTSIGDRAFYNCSSLTSITIPNSVTSIDDYTFAYCDKLAGITIPNSVTSVGNDAFYYCDSLTDVYYTGTESEWNGISIEANNSCLTNATIHFNHSKQDEYRINEITLTDILGSNLPTIPKGNFLATVSLTNVSSNTDAVIILAQYTSADILKGLMYIPIEDIPTGSTETLSVLVDNSQGDIATLKAFCWESLNSLIPVSNTASFPAQQK